MSRVTVSIDPHVHSEGSYDGHEPVELILEHAAEIGLDAVVITDHDVIRESKRAAEIASEYGLIGIPGVEVSTAHGHLLAIGVERMPPRGRPYAETVRWIGDRGGVAIVPHPFQRSRHGVRQRNIPTPGSAEDADEPVAADGAPDAGVVGTEPDPESEPAAPVAEVDAIEVFNAWLFTGYRNRRARRFAAKHGYPGIAASDAHHLQYVGRAFTELTVEGAESVREVTADDVLAAIRRGTTTVEGRRAPIRMAVKHYVGAAGRRSAYYARTGAARGARATKRTAVDGAVAAKVAALQSVHRTRRFLSWFA
ncbi:Predicted metal-dependent phosphoesterase TrpH, contains PHP domain [Halorubrum xinjiangense]|uniref:Predicted metal-dependent phosphoesterase TrpH, contains PHP domain n=1 Tax=Halorubrum xinjiangense TaxID=261291 RepID=A0A1G7MU81_9EURY|nr:PHP domain-containing protein [Halorubrum xinjiangense]SDF64620.1 Predicted metal-dependent phosphoesterase TrpH, contains PHP domain [Halorubrum xinjiangense]